jgi:tRNA1Val (adenine37-N6)-methyltransferase
MLPDHFDKLSAWPCPLSLDPEVHSRDELKRFGLTLVQSKGGYRFTLDPLLLCDFSGASGEQSIADLGTGCGVMALILARMAPEARVIAFEQDNVAAALARENVCLNELAGQVTVVHEDILKVRSCLPVSSCDLVVSNPPYRKQGKGRLNPDPGRLSARHETTAGLADFLSAAKYLVKPAGRICLVYHPDRLVDLISAAVALKLAVVRLRMVHGVPGAVAKVFLAELAKGRRNVHVQVMPPLLVRSDAENYTDEVRKILLGT